MNVKKINHFLQDVAAHNNREWFQEHKAEYLAAKSDFEEGIRKAIDHYAGFDDEIAHLQVKDCTYRFYRDIRFSSDKSPYKLGCSKFESKIRHKKWCYFGAAKLLIFNTLIYEIVL